MIAALILVERPKILQNKQGGHGKPMTAIVIHAIPMLYSFREARQSLIQRFPTR